MVIGSSDDNGLVGGSDDGDVSGGYSDVISIIVAPLVIGFRVQHLLNLWVEALLGSDVKDGAIICIRIALFF